MKKKILLILGIILVLISYIINSYSLIRLILLAIGILLIVLSYACKEKRNLFFLVILPIILVVASYGIDNILFAKFKRIPIFVIETKSSDKISVYNSFFYRIYNCNGKYVLDNGYQKSYMCDTDDLETIPINSFLSESLESYRKYDNKFIKINGKISKISGIDTIELSFFETEENTLNGHVKFGTSSILRIKTNADLSSYRIYDDFTVIGLVSSLETEGDVTVINLTDTLLLPNDVYNDYDFEVLLNDNKDIKDYIKDKNYYLYGLDNIFVKYSNDIIYELSYTITDSRISLDEIIKDIDPIETKNEEEEVIFRKYEKEKFNVYICSENEKTYFTNPKLKFNKELCEN